MDKNLVTDTKQAYLIIAHKDDLSFRTLLRMLDDKRNDIFIHMDVKNRSYNAVSVEQLSQYSRIVHVERTNVTWGGTAKSTQNYFCLKLQQNLVLINITI